MVPAGTRMCVPSPILKTQKLHVVLVLASQKFFRGFRTRIIIR